jgi:signal transduction histidine kinase
MLAHRLSQPLTSLRGSVEVALIGEVDESEFRQVLETLLKESHRMAEILEALRDILELEGAGDQVQPVSWTRTIKKLLKESPLVDGNEGLQLVSNVKEEIWVEAHPQHLETATARLIGRAIKAARGDRKVQISLSAFAEIACLSVCEGCQPPFPSDLLESADLDEWVVCRAVDRQGGLFKIGGASGARQCCHLSFLRVIL